MLGLKVRFVPNAGEHEKTGESACGGRSSVNVGRCPGRVAVGL